MDQAGGEKIERKTMRTNIKEIIEEFEKKGNFSPQWYNSRKEVTNEKGRQKKSNCFKS